MEYGINPMAEIKDVYKWRGYANLSEAKNAAKDIAEKFHTEVIVYEIIGMFKPAVTWKEITEDR